MGDWLSFAGRIVPMEWGDSTYTVLPVPQEIVAELERQGTRRVEIEINDHSFNMALTKAPAIAETFVYAGKSILREIGVSPGEELEIRLRKADPNVVEVPKDVTLAIRSAGLSEAWASLTPGRQRGLLHKIANARKPETRSRRIDQLLETLGN